MIMQRKLWFLLVSICISPSMELVFVMTAAVAILRQQVIVPDKLALLSPYPLPENFLRFTYRSPPTTFQKTELWLVDFLPLSFQDVAFAPLCSGGGCFGYWWRGLRYSAYTAVLQQTRTASVSSGKGKTTT